MIFSIIPLPFLLSCAYFCTFVSGLSSVSGTPVWAFKPVWVIKVSAKVKMRIFFILVYKMPIN